MLSPRIMLKLLDEARGVPVMFAIMLPSGNIVFEVRVFHITSPVDLFTIVLSFSFTKTGIYRCNGVAELED